MAALPLISPKPNSINDYSLSDRYDKELGRVFLTGTQALLRVLLEQKRRDKSKGLNSAGFITGYRGSPLGGVDKELWGNAQRLTDHNIQFLPAVNEDLGATAVIGSQQAALDPACDVDGIFAMWYGKGPGVDRSGDALKHGNAYGSHPKGGVLVVAGDDHGCVSSSMPHQSDAAFLSWFMPILNPTSVADYLEFGEYGYALSRYSGTWVGFKAISETVESAQSIQLKPSRVFNIPDMVENDGGLHVRSVELPSVEIEQRLGHKLKAVEAFVEKNPLDQTLYKVADARFGFVTTGKAHLDVMEALRLLGIDESLCKEVGIDIYKVGMVWPLAKKQALNFVENKHEIMVVEEKRGIIESQLKEYFYDWPGNKPLRMVGKFDDQLSPLLPWTGELTPRLLVPLIAKRLHHLFPSLNLLQRSESLLSDVSTELSVSGASRLPYFCSGCPHSTSTKVPEGSQASSGIGCHVMASWMGRNTGGFAQMGGEGVPHIVTSMFNGGKHRFQNMGEGTWYHSGSLAIRQAVAAKTNITFKILYNDAVAMTGGQPVDGPISVQLIAHSCRAEGIQRIAMVSDNIAKFDAKDFPANTSFHDRAELDQIQRELRDIDGVTVIIYEQICATEKRRKTKRGLIEDPKKFVVINELVCEGCGDCSVESNCLSVEPLATEFGTKRQINQSTCNKDFSCVDGFCPSFVTIEGGVRRQRSIELDEISELISDLPVPTMNISSAPYNILVTGVGGTGVVTVAALISMAAHLENKGASVLDFTGFAQKFGTVLSYVRLAETPEAIHQVRLDEASADSVIACDIVSTSSPKASVYIRPGTGVVLNEAEMPTADVVLNRDANLRVSDRVNAIGGVVGMQNVSTVNANALAETCFGNSVFANIILLGMAWQRGLVPVSIEAMMRAIELNEVAIDQNKAAFGVGRLLFAKPQALERWVSPASAPPLSTEELIAERALFLSQYQSRRYAARYQKTLEKFAGSLPESYRDEALSVAGKSLFKLMAYKDEYEVARLHGSALFSEKLAGMFEPGFTLNYHLAPPTLPLGKDARGRPNKRKFGPWMNRVFRVLTPLRKIRGTFFDPFAYQEDRKLERELIRWYEDILKELASSNVKKDKSTLISILEGPMDIRGYGPVKQQAAVEVQTRLTSMLAA